MVICDGKVTMNQLKLFVEKHQHQKGSVSLQDHDDGDYTLHFIPDEIRFYHMSITPAQQMQLSHTVPGLGWRCSPYENETLNYHSLRIRDYVWRGGFCVWGNHRENAEWFVLVDAHDVAGFTDVVHYNVPHEEIKRILDVPEWMRTGIRKSKKPRRDPLGDSLEDSM